MNLLNKTYIVFFIILFITSCNNIKEDSNPKFLAPIDIKIPHDLIENIETVDFFKSTENEFNEFSENIETMVFNGKEILLKDPKDRSKLEKNKFELMSVQFVSNITQMNGILEKTLEYIEKAKINGFDKSQIKSLEIIKGTLQNRIEDINNKYKKYFKIN